MRTENHTVPSDDTIPTDPTPTSAGPSGSGRSSNQASNQGSSSYGAKDIQVLEGLDPVRKRPGMYIGSTGLDGLHHLIVEVVDNAVDEAMAGYATRIGVTLQDDGGCRVDDNGRGIPVDTYPSGRHKGKSAAEVVLTVLHAGGKFGGEGYKVSGGLHGVGVSVVNALSERLILEVDSGGQRYRQEYAKGGKPQGKLEVVGPTPARGRTTGTTVTFWPDPTIFMAEGTEFVARTVRERLQTMAFLNRGLEIVFVDERADKEGKTTFQYRGGLIDFVKHLNASKEALFAKVCSFEDADADGQMLDIAMQWNTGYYEGIHGYANGISTTEGGMHVEGFKTALTSVVNKYARSKNLLKEKDDNLLGEDIREGITAIVAVKLRDPQFEGQTKAKLGNVPIRSFVQTGDERAPRRMARGEPRRSQPGREEGARRRPGARCGEERPQRHPPQDLVVRRRHARQAQGLLVEGRRRERAVHRRRRLRRWHRPQRPRPAHPGDVADPRQDPQRRAGPPRQDAEEQRDPGADHCDRRGSGRGVRRHQGPLPQGDRARRRRRRRQPHPHPPADVLLPPDATAGRGRVRVHRPAAAVLHRGRQGEGVPEGRCRQGGVPRRPSQSRQDVPAPEGPRRDGLGRAQGHHDGRRHSHAAAGHRRAGSTRRRGDERADGRRRREPSRLHHHQRPRRPQPRLLYEPRHPESRSEP